MAIHCINSHFFCIACHEDARDIAVSIQWNLQLPFSMGYYIVAPYRHHRVLLASYRIFIGVEAWIVSKLLSFWTKSFKQGHRVLLYSCFIITNPDHIATISCKDHRTVVAKFFLIYPIRYAVDDFITSPVCRHTSFLKSIQIVFQIDIIISHKGYILTIRREQGSLLVAYI